MQELIEIEGRMTSPLAGVPYAEMWAMGLTLAFIGFAGWLLWKGKV